MRLKNIREEEEINIIGLDKDRYIHKPTDKTDVLDMHTNFKWNIEI